MARLRPSSAHRWVECPASVQTQEQYPDDEEETEASREGTAVHWVASTVLDSFKDKMTASPVLASDLTGKCAPNGVIITDEMSQAAAEYVREILKVCNDSGLIQAMRIEQSVKIPRVHATENEGTPDCAIFNDKIGVLHVWDFKFGFGLVESYGNWQLIDYAIGILDELSVSDLNIRVNLTVIQPRAYHPEGIVRTWSMRGDDLRSWGNKLHDSAHNALADDPFMRSGIHCKHCSAISVCQAANRASMNSIDVSQMINIEELPVNELAVNFNTLKRAKEMIDHRLTGIESIIAGHLKKGKQVVGLTLHSKPGALQWTKPDDEVIALGSLMGQNLVKPRQLITPTQAQAKGIDETVINAYSKRKSGSMKVVDSKTLNAEKIFSKK